MRAITRTRYGSPSVLRIVEVPTPVPTDDQVLVRVRAASVNPLDWHNMRGHPYLVRMQGGWRRPKNDGLGADLAGVVESVGAKVTRFAPGDEVFGMSQRTLAEYVRVAEDGLVRKPATVTFVEAAAVPVSAITALQGLRDAGRVTAGQRVLIVGASGGVGTFAVQLARTLGAHVTGVCSTRNVELVRSLGADEVIDYTKNDFARGPERFDVVFDGVGQRSLSELRRPLRDGGIVVLVGGGSGPFMLRTMYRMLIGARRNKTARKPAIFLFTHRAAADLTELARLLETGAMRSVIDRTYPFAETADALRYLEDGHARGKVVVTL